jgi:hypothetical protein
MYVRDMLLHRLYEREDFAGARRYADRLERLLDKEKSSQGAVRGAECRSLIAEARRDLKAAIKHREEEVTLWKRLRDSLLGPKSNAAYEPEDLADSLELLAILYDRAGRRDAAVEALRDSEEHCRRTGIPFESSGLLKDLANPTSAHSN